jgi:hypothetical protein
MGQKRNEIDSEVENSVYHNKEGGKESSCAEVTVTAQNQHDEAAHEKSTKTPTTFSVTN